MFGILTPPEIAGILTNQLIGRLGCIDEDSPYVVPVSYAFENNGIYIYSMEGKKLNLLRINPAACFQVDDTRDLSRWQSVLCYGTFQELTTKEDRRSAFRILSKRKIPFVSSKTMQLSAEWPFRDDHADAMRGIFFRINIKEMTGRFEKADDVNYYAS